MDDASSRDGLTRLVERGGVYYNIPGVSPQDVLANLAAAFPVPDAVDRTKLLDAVLEREALMPTGVGNGIALPHPRNPLVSDPSAQSITIGFLQRPVDWHALDGKPVRTLILIVSASPKLHLRTLSRISFLCQQESFRRLLDQRASREEIVEAILSAEKEWNGQ